MIGDTLWAWQEQEPDGSWGTIAALVPGFASTIPLVTRDPNVAATFSSIAKAHGKASGHPVRLGRFDLAEVAP